MGGKKYSRILPDFVYMTKPTRGPGACAINSAFLFLIVRRTIRFFVVKITSHKNALSSVNDLGEKMEALLCRIQSESRSLFIVLVKDRVNYF